MKKILCSYGDSKYKKSLDLLKKSALEIGKVDRVNLYTREWLENTDFYRKSKQNQYILNQPRGGGYWLYKVPCILDAFKHLEDGDIVLYSDAGLTVIDNLNPLFEIAQNKAKGGRMVFRIPHIGATHVNKIWTKRDAFVLTNCNEQKYWDAVAMNGALSLWKKTEKNTEFLKEWLQYLKDPRISTDQPNMCGPNDISFKEHRHDQSVLSILAKKYDFEVYRDPTQYGNEEKHLFKNSPYEQLFDHHRTKNK